MEIAEDFELGDAAETLFLDPSEPLSPDPSMEVQNLLTAAETERLWGCFAQAEVNLRKAFALSNAHCSALVSTAAARLGRLYAQFLPGSDLGADYLRVALKHATVDCSQLRLWLAEQLICTEDFDEADSILSEVESEREVTLLKGRALLQRGDLLKSEEVLRTYVGQLKRTGNAEDLGSALGYLGTVLYKKQQYAESDSVLSESISILADSPGTSLTPVLRTYGKLCVKSQQFSKLSRTMTSVQTRLRESPLSPYYIAEVLIVYSDCIKLTHRHTAVQCLLDAVHIYERVREPSWYQVTALWRLAELSILMSEPQSAALDKRLLRLVSSLPMALSPLGLDFDHQSRLSRALGGYLRRVKELADSSTDAVCRGEAMLRLIPFIGTERYVVHRYSTEVHQFIEEHAGTRMGFRLAVRLFSSKHQKKSHQVAMLKIAEGIHNRSRCYPLTTVTVKQSLARIRESAITAQFEPLKSDSLFEDSYSRRSLRPAKLNSTADFSYSEVLDLLQSAYSTASSVSPVSKCCAAALKAVANFHERRGNSSLAERALTAVADMLREINPLSSRTASALCDLGLFYQKEARDAEAEGCFSRAVAISVAYFPGLVRSAEIVGHMQKHLQVKKRVEDMEKLISEYLEKLKGLEIAEKSLYLSELEKFASAFARVRKHSKAVRLYLRGLQYVREVEKSVPNILLTGNLTHIHELSNSLQERRNTELQLTAINLFRWVANLYEEQSLIGKTEVIHVKKVVWREIHPLHYEEAVALVRGCYTDIEPS